MSTQSIKTPSLFQRGCIIHYIKHLTKNKAVLALLIVFGFACSALTGMKAVLALLVVLGFASSALAGSYGGGGGGYYNYYKPAIYPQYGYVKPYYPAPVVKGGVGFSDGSGIIIPIIIIFVLLAVFAPVLIGSLVSSNEALWDSIDRK